MRRAEGRGDWRLLRTGRLHHGAALQAVLLICAMCVSVTTYAQDYTYEQVTYKVMYKWGLINKQAGRATLTIRDSGDRYVTQLVARSEPWADKFYTVRDTLNGVIDKEPFRPLFYEKIAHEGSEDKHDVVNFSYRDGTVYGDCSRVAYKDGELRKNQTLTLSSTTMTVDMLSSYYYMRRLPFENWQPRKRHILTIFSGKQKETLTFEYHGIEDIKIDGVTYNCFHITFIFTGNGGKKTSDDMDAWITTDARRLPVQLEGKLPVGKVRCQIMK